jgi:hypothetical protein
MRLRRVTLAPNAVLPGPSAGGVQLAGPASRTGHDLLRTADDAYRNASTAPLEVYVWTIQPQTTPATAPAAAGTATP